MQLWWKSNKYSLKFTFYQLVSEALYGCKNNDDNDHYDYFNDNDDHYD